MFIQDEKFMGLAIQLAEKGRGKVSPNPCVGAVVVRRGCIVGKGYHARFGGAHAEVMALKQAGTRAKGATLYVSLEPCSTFGKTPPCCEAIVKSGIKRVVMGTLDPNPLHRGKSLSWLKKKKIAVKTGVKEAEARHVILGFQKWILKKRPYVIVKEAMTLDGKIATKTGDSRWISSPASRLWVHQLRHQVDAILVGKQTLLKDNPQLTVRLKKKNSQPIRILFSKDGMLPSCLNLFSQPGQTWIATGQKLSLSLEKKWKQRGVEILKLPAKGEDLSLPALLKQLGQRGITSLLVEGGGKTVYRFLQAKVVDKIYFFIAPKIIGGEKAMTPVEGEGMANVQEAWKLKKWNFKPIGPDLLIEGEF